MTKTIARVAEEIVAGAIEAGATAEMIARWDLMPGDVAHIRAEWSKPDAGETEEEAAARVEVEDWRQVYAEVESAVRERSYMAE